MNHLAKFGWWVNCVVQTSLRHIRSGQLLTRCRLGRGRIARGFLTGTRSSQGSNRKGVDEGEPRKSIQGECTVGGYLGSGRRG